ncbi:MAG: Hsp20/alpha crystallin family protein [Bacilli bacterium]
MNLIPRNFYLDDMFDNFLATKETNNMKCDIYEKDGKYHIEMDIPGVKREDIKIETDNGYLTISVSKSEEKEDENKNYIRKERYSKEYKREFYLGDIDAENIKAEFKNNTLKIELPKQEEIETKKTIEIE